MAINGKRNTLERRTLILERIDSHGQVNVSELSQDFGVSEVTIRNDLNQLEQKRAVIRARGGAIKPTRVGVDFELSDKDKLNFKEKQRIGERAAHLVEDGDTIIIDSGTTTLELAKNLTQATNLTVITNALNIAIKLSENKDIKVIVPGGFLRKQSLSLVGTPAEKGFRGYYCDKLFLGVDGLDVNYGLSTPNIEEAHLNQVMIEHARQVILLSDSSKFLRKSLAFICPLSSIDILVTDDKIEPEDQRQLESSGVQVLLASVSDL